MNRFALTDALSVIRFDLVRLKQRELQLQDLIDQSPPAGVQRPGWPIQRIAGKEHRTG